jgi:hypothetical protein
MPDSVEAKLRKVEDEHALEVHTERQVTHERARRDRAMQMFGAAKYAEGLRAHTATQIIEFLMMVEEEKLYLDYDHETFADFLENSPLSELSKSSYYRMRELYMKEGPQRFDLLSEWKIPARIRKLLTAGDIEIDGDEVVIGGEERVSLAEQTTIKAVIERQVKEKLELAAANEKLTKKVEKQKEQINRGQEEYDELRRNFDAVDENTRFERAVMQLMNAFFNLTEAVGELNDEEKTARANDDLKLVAGLYYKLSDAYGSKAALTDDRELELKLSKLKPVEEMTEEEKRESFLDRHVGEVMSDTEDLD